MDRGDYLLIVVLPTGLDRGPCYADVFTSNDNGEGAWDIYLRGGERVDADNDWPKGWYWLEAPRD